MGLTQDDVIQILKLIQEAPVGHFSLQVGDLKLEVDKGDGPAARPPARPLLAPAAALAAPPVGDPAAVTPDAQPAPQPAVQRTGATEAGSAVIKAPILGIFYRRAQPGVPPFVEEGSLVEEDTTVALIEVMKLFNQVRAGVRGRIVRVCAEDGSLVEHGQELFRVEPT